MQEIVGKLIFVVGNFPTQAEISVQMWEGPTDIIVER